MRWRLFKLGRRRLTGFFVKDGLFLLLVGDGSDAVLTGTSERRRRKRGEDEGWNLELSFVCFIYNN